MGGFENSVVASAVGLSLLMKNLDLNLKIWTGCAHAELQMGSAGDFILTSICTTEDISSYLNEGDGGVFSSCPSSLKDRILKRPQLWRAIKLMTKSCSK